MDTDATQHDETRRAIRLAAILVLLLCVAGVAGIRATAKLGLWRSSMFFEQFANEGLGIAIVAAGAIAMLWMAAAPPGDGGTSPAWLSWSRAQRITLVIAVLVIVRAGSAVVFGDYPFIDDEYHGRFQAIVYASGHATATAPQPWCQWISALTPTGIIAKDCTWSLSYFPVNSLVRAGFIALHLDAFMHPVIAALTILLVFDICRRLWPDAPERATLAALLLACSSQFLFMSMAGFSMPLHLLVATLWLWLYVRPERWALALLPWIGVIGLGVHSPYPHSLFVAPLVFRYLVARRFGTFLYVATVYAAGSVAWVNWHRDSSGPIATYTLESAGAVAATATGALLAPRGEALPNALASVIIGTWSVPIAVAAFLVAVLLWKRLDSLTRWIAASFIFTFLARSLLFPSYGAGWGHRYVYAALTSFVIVVAVGISLMAESVGRRAYRVAGLALASAVLVQLPYRGVQAVTMSRPYHNASQYLASIPAEVVIMQFQSLQWGRQLLRNDPFLRTSPKLMDLKDLTAAQQDSIEKTFPGRVRFVRPEAITVFGVKPASRIGRFEIR